MILDLLSTDMYFSVNIKLAHRIGLHAAIYLGELLNINRKAIQKEKTIDNTFFKLNRDYIEQRTTIQKQEQKEIDKLLEELSIINVGTNKDILSINTNALTGLLLDDNSELVDKILQPVKKRRMTKQETITANLKNNICTDNEELRKAYEEWIDAVIARQGWMSTASVRDGQDIIDKYTNKDLDMALKIIEIGAINGLRDLTWAINTYEKQLREGKGKSLSPSNSYVARVPAIAEDEVF